MKPRGQVLDKESTFGGVSDCLVKKHCTGAVKPGDREAVSYGFFHVVTPCEGSDEVCVRFEGFWTCHDSESTRRQSDRRYGCTVHIATACRGRRAHEYARGHVVGQPGQVG